MLPSQDLNLKLRSLDVETGSAEPQHYFTAMKANVQTLESACQRDPAVQRRGFL